jgi:hypothetical protein
LEEWLYEWPRGVNEKGDGVGDERVTEGDVVYDSELVARGVAKRVVGGEARVKDLLVYGVVIGEAF